MTKHIITIVGARPQFIKAAALSRALKKNLDIIETLVHTGQHYDENMSKVFFDELDIPTPAHKLKIHGGTHAHMTSRMLEGIEPILLKDKPNAVLVYGDTNSTLAGALAASKLHIPVIHIEAGLRSYNRKMPEEINRVLTDHMSSLLLCPTAKSVTNLQNEGIVSGVHQVGDIMYDATLYALSQVKENQYMKAKFFEKTQEFAIMTIHRAESTSTKENLQRLIEFADAFSKKNHVKIILPLHPRTKKLLGEYSLDLSDRFIVKNPLSYYEIQICLSKASYVLTDSGGLQKEAYFHRVPCVTLRSETEWVETIDQGWNRLWTVEDYKPRSDISDYGDGHCAEEIVKIIKDNLS